MAISADTIQIIYTIKMNNIPQLNVKLPDGNLGCIEKEIIAPLNNVYIKTMITNYFMENTEDNRVIHNLLSPVAHS